jgi:hypothetical protein
LLHKPPDGRNEGRERQSRLALFDTPAGQDQRVAAQGLRRLADQPALAATGFGADQDDALGAIAGVGEGVGEQAHLIGAANHHGAQEAIHWSDLTVGQVRLKGDGSVASEDRSIIAMRVRWAAAASLILLHQVRIGDVMSSAIGTIGDWLWIIELQL